MPFLVIRRVTMPNTELLAGLSPSPVYLWYLMQHLPYKRRHSISFFVEWTALGRKRFDMYMYVLDHLTPKMESVCVCF